jgi:AraC-like DNA-binding protein
MLLSPRRPLPWTEGPGLKPLLHSQDFGQWEAVLANTLGHHRSRLRPGSQPFEAQIRSGSVDDFQVLWLQGTGHLELQREQCGDGVLWLPIQGLMQETINGEEHVAEPGTGLMFRPGDAMTGLSTETVSGISIIVPNSYLVGRGPVSPLFRQGSLAQRLINAAWTLVEAAATQAHGASFAAERLVDVLHQACHPLGPDQKPERVTAIRRRELVGEACLWMQDRLAERFSVVELSAAFSVSVRTIQTSFQAELGCSPMAELKRLRLHQLRSLLLDPELQQLSVAQLMAEAGLLACGVTAADYRRWCGELPLRTRKTGTN